MNKLKTAVIGAGHLGKFHAEKYAGLNNSELIFVVDTNVETAKAVADKHQAVALTDYKNVLGKVDAVSIATPARFHHKIAHDVLEHGIHVLVEKPITVNVDDANDLIAIAQANHLVIQVGHLERFNAVLTKLENILKTPKYIESLRLAPINPRVTDIDVVLDLMIHDIDIILNIVKSEITDIRVSGTRILTDRIDIANARLEFQNGCVANITASRVSVKSERRIRIFQQDCYISADLQNGVLKVHRKGEKEIYPGITEIINEQTVYNTNDALKLEIIAFLDSIQNGTPVAVSGQDGRRALETAINISALLEGK